MKTTGARAAFDNSEWHVHFAQSVEAITALKKSDDFGMTDHLERALKSIRRKDGVYSECVVKNGGDYSIARLHASKYEALMCSSKSQDFSLIEDRVKAGETIDEAIENILRMRGDL